MNGQAPGGHRRRPSGARHVIAYNWPLYLAGGAVTVGAALVARRSRGIVRAVAWTAGAAASWWTAASLVASHVVYDRSPLHGWEWLSPALVRAGRPPRPGRHLVVSSGLDEASAVIGALHPGCEQTVADLYDALPVVESSLRRARRRVAPRPESVACSADALPAPDASVDTVIAPFALHELRAADDREAAFGEVARILRPGGALVLVEHCRDAANIAAYGPGAEHFMPRARWLRTARGAGLRLAHERRMGGLVTVFVLVGPER
ncbi:class I SAM-dependent methyltransferase [Nocardiopsis sp. EMB25]|uniref:class I SAM-dependent methyltransferase n=1 Tax=Nocardiopsis sp. EMB25 TaxID=2835867 RepID=UPI00228431D2|nr:methyltransferase domain-containing protein [Nocardiopsis sp. EMB25]MCY9785301.1 class I SAM-dependent methyltransferase [Nocardiopsis sp. EMB25]